MKFDVNTFVADRNAAFAAFVMDDNWGAVEEYCARHHIQMPDDPNILAAGVYKAVQECAGIPAEVKAEALRKCTLLGFYPFMLPPEQAAPTIREDDAMAK